MDQNTAQNNNVQFNYPDFSGNSTQPKQNPSNDDKKIEELKKSLDTLMQQDQAPAPQKEEVVSTPEPVQPVQPVQETPVPLPPMQKLERKEEEKPVPQVEPPKKEPVVEGKVEEKYVQTPTPIPALQKEKELPKQEDISQLASSMPIPEESTFDPLPSDLPKFKESLDSIMPDFKKPKAMVREPKNDSLAKPIKVNKQRDENLTRQEDATQDTPSIPEVIPGEGLMIEKLLSEAINRNASDLHLAVGYPPIIRVDGDLVDLEEKVLDPEDAEKLIFSVLTDERKELLEVNREIDFAYTYEAANNARFRVNAYYSMRNLSAAFRLIPSRVRTIEELMLPQIYNQFAKLKQGLVLVTGPTGHGKSTTIASILEAINRTRFCHIVTIEDPIEYVFEGKKALIDQREMNDDTHSWNIALRSALRQDPDVILVGEMRDYETIASAITLAETGHLVFATLHTNSAAQTLDRIIDVFPETQQQQVRTQVANTLEAVVAQRLIPLDKGGRRAVSEIMLNNSAISNLIREGKMHQVDNVIRTSSDIGMVYLERSLVNLVREGVISVQKAQEYAVHPEEVLRLLKS